jgi:hypothetical protein
MSNIILIVKSLSQVNRSIFFQCGYYNQTLVRLRIGTGEPNLLGQKINILQLKERRVRT